MGIGLGGQRLKDSASWSRRQFVKIALASAGLLFAPTILGGAKAKVVVIGGGAGGATAARALASHFQGLDISLVEANWHYVTPFFSNRYLTGLRSLGSLTHSYEKVDLNPGVRVVHERVTKIDAEKKRVRLLGGRLLSYDRLIVAPGTDLIHDAIEGYDPAAEKVLPHAYNGTTADQWIILRGQLQAMENGGLVVITVPRRPYRCAPAPYERASLIAAYLMRRKPRSKILILDANQTFPMMDVMLESWDKHFGQMIEWVSSDFGGAVLALDPTTRSIMTADDRFFAAVANVIPPQRAGSLAQATGLASETGWCPVNPKTFESLCHRDIHVLGDAIDAGDMPKSASAASSQALVCAVAVGNAFTESSAPAPDLTNACYFLVREGNAFVVGGRYRVNDGLIVGVEGFASEPGEDDGVRAATAKAADRWYADITRKMFG